MTDHSDLIAELRATAHDVYTPDNVVLKLEAAAAALSEAWDIIEKERATVDMLNSDAGAWHRRAVEATRQRDEALAALKASEEREAPLRTALEPFAREAAEWGAKVPDNAVIRIDGPCCDHPEDALFTVGDLRRARSVLENGPSALADATNKYPGTEQREAGV